MNNALPNFVNSNGAIVAASWQRDRNRNNMGMTMGYNYRMRVVGLLALLVLALGSSSATALVIPGTPEYGRRESVDRRDYSRNTYYSYRETPSYYQEDGMIYSIGAEREPRDRSVRMSYRSASTAKGRAYRRGSPLQGSPLENARRSFKGESAASEVHASTPGRTINYRNPTRPPVARWRSTGLRIPGRSDPAPSNPTPARAVASWYGWDFHGRKTANGETYNMYEHTAAHKTLPFGTVIRVTNLRNGRQKIVRINDRGPFVAGRDIDLSYATARDLGMLESGVEDVRLEIISG